MKKYGRHYLRRGLSVLLAVVMTCAAAQSLVYAVELAENDTVTPGWNEGAAHARYTTSGELQLTFPVVKDRENVLYYADFYDLDSNTRNVALNTDPVQLNTTRTYADGEATELERASLDPKYLADTYGIDFSHRISIAITAVDADNWRSEPIETRIGQSLDIPMANSSPDKNDDYVLLADFDHQVGNDNMLTGEITTNSVNSQPSWYYNGVGSAELNSGALNIDGVFDNEGLAYQTPGFDNSYAFRAYVNGSSRVTDPGQYETLDIQYNQQHYMFRGAEDLWIWVDTSYVNFDEFAVRVKYSDRTGTLKIRDNKDGIKGTPAVAYSKDSYSTVGYAMRHSGSQIPVYYVNEAGLWDTMYTNEQGYLEDFGHYRGFLRVPVEYLENDNPDESKYITIDQERPYNYNIRLYYMWAATQCDDEETFTAKEAFEGIESTGQYSFDYYIDGPLGSSRSGTFTLSSNELERYYGEGLSVTPIEDIISVGIQYRGLSEDSLNKPFYIDHIGFSGANMTTNTTPSGALVEQDVSQSLDSFQMVPNDEDAVALLIDQYLPSPANVTVADLSVVEDLEDICGQLGIAYPSELQTARSAINNLLAGSANLVEYVANQLESENVDSNLAVTLYRIYNGFTLGEIQTLGVTNEAKLIDAYNDASSDIWFPSALDNMGWVTFNEMEEGYTLGQTALHQYDDNHTASDYQAYDSNAGGSAYYYSYGHMLTWDDAAVNNYSWIINLTHAYENSRNLVAYSRYNYGADNTADAANNNKRFGYGITTVGQNGFENSQSVDTDIYRSIEAASDPANSEAYRISLTANGQEEPQYGWNAIKGINAEGAQYLAFYADFSEMQDLSELWATIRTGPDATQSSPTESLSSTGGAIRSSQDHRGSIQFLDYENPNTGWEDTTPSALNGRRGIVRIPLEWFASLDWLSDNARGNSFTLSDVRQIKIFVRGTANNPNAAGSTFSLDMFGFMTDTKQGVFSQSLKEQYSEPLNVPVPHENAYDHFIEHMKELFTPATDINNNSIQLFNRDAKTETEESIYDALLDAYYTLTPSDKEKADSELASYTSYHFASVDHLKLFVINYDTWGNLGAGMLAQNATKAVDCRTDVETAFNANTQVLNTGDIDAILDAYDKYPDYYKYAVQTYWPDRNLHAVYPNYNPEAFVDNGSQPGSTVNNPVEFVLNEAGDIYTATVTIPYVGATSTDNPLNFELPENKKVTLTTAGNVEILADINAVNLAVVNGKDASLQLTLTVPFDSIQHGGVYNGSFTVGVNMAPDLSTGQLSNGENGTNAVQDAGKYRQEFPVYLKLTSEAKFTVTIPADTTVDWGANETVMSRYAVEDDLFLPKGASLTLDITSGESNDFEMVNGDKAIAYTLMNDQEQFQTITDVKEPNEYNLSVNVDDDQWTQGGLASGTYTDNLTFTVKYVEATA